jgi:hypothetical protein
MRTAALVDMHGPEQGGNGDMVLDSHEWQLIAAGTKKLRIDLGWFADQMVVQDSRYVSDP